MNKKVIIQSEKMLFYATKGSVGIDIKANLSKVYKLKPGERMLVPTGIYLTLPKNIEAQIRPRSGLAIKHGLTVLNSPGTIDSDYKGEIKVILINLGNEVLNIQNNMPIAQMVFNKTIRIKHIPIKKKTKRGSGGFGHTDKI